MLTSEEKKARLEERRKAREQGKKQAQIESEKNQKPVKSITISIEWKKSRTWGANPHAMAKVEFQDGTFKRQDGFTCSGCGYDKTSTVVAEIFDTFLKYKLWNREIPDNAPYGIVTGNCGYEYRHYGGGIGISCYPSISKFIGGSFEAIASGKSFDVFRYTDGEVKNELY